ncbi:hypothetical protein D1831_12475 [Lactiplantibacillus garii]|uniref:Uncharacterized protein n=1 Tax=Lactiplantibacillus garii TaxID=2306423 RepID=A0A3R8J5F0_9LACO|nr:hypothetical protein [Lactiplantibacillus garii]RRK09485.1 hypothetical protein D1831_12475 [Lactiplantibacillus garii]
MIKRQPDRFNWSDLVWNQLPARFDTQKPNEILRWAERCDAVNLQALNTFFNWTYGKIRVPKIPSFLIHNGESLKPSKLVTS